MKVRSATLDTWLPEQVAFMQGEVLCMHTCYCDCQNYSHTRACFAIYVSLGMGNAKANAFWEAELPQSFKRPSENDRGGLESFIRAKYFSISL